MKCIPAVNYRGKDGLLTDSLDNGQTVCLTLAIFWRNHGESWTDRIS